MRTKPAFAATVVLTLAVGIGLNTAIFSLLDAMLLEPLAVPHPNQLVEVTSSRNGGNFGSPYMVWEQIRDRHLFESAFAWSFNRFNTSPSGRADYIDGMWASGNIFDVLGIQTIAGRTLTSADDRPGGGPDGPVANISYQFWQRRFGGAPDVIGRSLTIERVPFTIVGVLPKSFHGLDIGLPFDVALPIGAGTLLTGARTPLSGFYVNIMARLRPGETIAAAGARLQAEQSAIRRTTALDYTYQADRDAYLREPLAVRAAPNGRPFLAGIYGTPLRILWILAGLVLLMTCVSVANLLLTRTAARRHEFSVRAALGASRIRLMRHLLVESLWLVGPAVCLAILFAQASSRLLANRFSTDFYRVSLDLAVDWRTLAFAVACGIATVLIFGSVPALSAAQASPLDSLKQESSHAGGRRLRLNTALIVAQVALSLALVVAAGLLARTWSALAAIDPGMDADQVLVVHVDVPSPSASPLERVALYDRLTRAVAAVPGVAADAVSQTLPAGNLRTLPLVAIPGGIVMSASNRFLAGNSVAPGWFRAVGTPLEAGRDFTDADGPGAPHVAIVNRAFVHRLLGGANPVGRTIYVLDGSTRHPLVIVGLVADSVQQTPVWACTG